MTNKPKNINKRISDLLIKLSSKSEENKEVLELLTDIQMALPPREPMFDFVQTGIAIYEAIDNGNDFVFVDFNKKAEEIEGISKAKVIGKKVTEVFPGVKKFGILDAFQKVWKTGKPINHPVKVYEDERIKGWRENYIFKLKNGNVVASYFDLTKQKQTEEKVLISETNLKALINNREESVWSIDNEYNFIVFNNYFKEKYFENNKIELEIGINALDLLSKEKYNFWKEKYDRCLTGENFSFEFEEFEGKEKHYFEASFIPIKVEQEIRGVSAVCRDITEQKIVQQKIKESEEKYRAIFDNDKVNMLLFDPKTLKIVDANKGAEKFYGWTREEFLNISISYINLMPEKEIKERIKELQKEPAHYFEFKHRKKDGSVSDVAIIRGDIVLNGRNLFYLIISDITLKKNAEEKIKTQEENYRNIFNSSSDAIYILNKDSVFIDVNSGAEKMYGMKKEELVGKTPAIVGAPGKNDLAKVKELNDKAYNGEEQTFQFWGIRKNGEIFPKEVKVYPGKYNGEKVIIAVGRDISERIKYEQSLRESEEKYRNLIKFAPDAFFQGDTDGNFIDCNVAASVLTGYSREELLKMNMSDIFSKDVLNQEPLRYDLLEKGKVVTLERKIKLKDKSEIFVEMTSNKLNNNTLQSFMHDITERKNSELALEESERNFRLLFENSPLGTFIANKKGEILDGNKSLLNMIGSPSLDATREINVLTFPPLIENGYAKLFKKCIKEKKTIAFNLDYKSKWGVDSIFSNYIIPVIDDDGKVTKVYTLMEDITDRFRSEEALRESEELFKNLTNSTSTAIFIFQNQKFVFINNAVEKLTGYSKKELLKMNFWDVIHPDHQDLVKERGLKRQAGEKVIPRYQFKLLRKDGKETWIDFTANAISWSGTPAAIGSAVDITELKKAETKLRKSEEQYRLISNLTSDYVFSNSITEDNKVVTDWVGGSFEEISGYTLEEFKEIGWQNTLHKDDIEKDIEAHKKLLKNESIKIEVRIIRKDGTTIWVEVLASPIWDKAKNKLKGIRGAVKDITEAKRNEIIHSIQYNIADAIASSQNITDLFKIVRGELNKILNAKNFYIAFYEENTNMFVSEVEKDEKDSFERWPAEGSLSGYLIHKRKKLLIRKDEIIKLAEDGAMSIIGTIPEVWLGVPLIIKGSVIGIMAIQNYDDKNAYSKSDIELFEVIGKHLSLFIEKNKTKEDSLRLSRAIVQSPVSVAITNSIGEIEYVNPQFEKTSGYTFEELVGMNNRILKSGNQSKEFYEDLWETILAGLDWRGEILNKKKNGDLYWENSVISPIENEKREITHFVAIKEDITEKKKILEELIEAKEKAVVSERIKTEFLAQMSHEIRSPLNVILSYIGLIKDEVSEYIDEDLKSSFKSIDTASTRITRTIDLILNMTDLQIGSYESNVHDLNVVDLMKNIHSQYKQYAQDKNLELNLNINFTRKRIKSDEYALGQILSNLVDNAIKYTKEGSIEIFADKHGKRDVVLKVIDTGIGMAKNFLPNLFNSFTQEEQGYSRSYDGNGLGMSLVKKYCDIIDAEISVESKKGKGTIFTLIVPNKK